MAYKIAATAVTLKVIHRLQAFCSLSNICAAFTRFQLTVRSQGPSALAELLVLIVLVF